MAVPIRQMRRERGGNPCRIRAYPAFGRLSAVMPVPGLDTGIVAGIHVFLPGFSKQDEDGRDKPGQARP